MFKVLYIVLLAIVAANAVDAFSSRDEDAAQFGRQQALRLMPKDSRFSRKQYEKNYVDQVGLYNKVRQNEDQDKRLAHIFAKRSAKAAMKDDDRFSRKKYEKLYAQYENYYYGLSEKEQHELPLDKAMPIELLRQKEPRSFQAIPAKDADADRFAKEAAMKTATRFGRFSKSRYERKYREYYNSYIESNGDHAKRNGINETRDRLNQEAVQYAQQAARVSTSKGRFSRKAYENAFNKHYNAFIAKELGTSDDF